MTETELVAKVSQFNPVDNLQGLLSIKVPMFVVHGDSDVVVPYDDNTRRLKERYEADGGSITVKIIPGEGHKVSPAFFECQELVGFVIEMCSDTSSCSGPSGSFRRLDLTMIGVVRSCRDRKGRSNPVPPSS
jgi:hypothetical protein